MTLPVSPTLQTAIPLLEAAGVDTPRLDAELLLAHVLGVRRTNLIAHPERVLTDAEAERFQNALRRRLQREPLPYITGTREFLGLVFRVTPAVLIPRPETEVLVETVAEQLAALRGREYLFRLMDVGAGSGCVAIGLAHLLPQARVVAIEPSAAALAVARENAGALGVAERIEWVEGTFPEAVAMRRREFDAVVSNPPYIPAEEVTDLQAEVRDWEPRQALTPGPSGLELIRALAERAPGLMRRVAQPDVGMSGPRFDPAASSPGTRSRVRHSFAVDGGFTPRHAGLLALEVAMGQADRVMALLHDTGRYSDIEAVRDLGGIPRVCLGWVRG